MNSSLLAVMLGASLILGGIALAAFLWGLKSGQFDDKEKWLGAVKFDNEDDLRSAAEIEQRKKELKAKKKQKKENYRPE